MRGFCLKKFRKADVLFAMFLICAIAFMIVSPMVILPKVYGVSNIWNKDLPTETTFVELWQVDTFEGGIANRARYLEKTAYKFQELNNNVYVFVRTMEVEQMKLMLAKGKKPDMISFGVGVGETIQAYCKELDIKNAVRGEVLKSGVVDNKLLAMPWCMGGYVLANMMDIDMENLPNKPMKGYEKVLGYGGDCNITANALVGIECNSVCNEGVSQYDAYKQFLTGKNFNVLLGTQRDYYRLKNKVDLGVIPNCEFKYLTNYTDLVQYIAITTDNEGVMNCAKNFIKYLTSVTVQKTLTQIGMFGVSSVKIYSDENVEFENAILNTKNILNVFTSDAELNEMRKIK